MSKSLTQQFAGYRFLLTAQLVVLIVLAALDHQIQLRFFTGALFLLIILAGLRAITRERKHIVAMLIFAALAMLGYLAQLLAPNAAWQTLYLLGFLLFFAMASFLMLRDILVRSREVSADLIVGSVSVYLMLGLGFAFLYALLETLMPGSFGGLEAVQGGREPIAPLIYYSYVTLTTLGYGDVSPVTNLTMTMAYLEAILGQLYLAVLVARLVGIHVSRSASPQSH